MRHPLWQLPNVEFKAIKYKNQTSKWMKKYRVRKWW